MDGSHTQDDDLEQPGRNDEETHFDDEDANKTAEAGGGKPLDVTNTPISGSFKDGEELPCAVCTMMPVSFCDEHASSTRKSRRKQDIVNHPPYDRVVFTKRDYRARLEWIPLGEILVKVPTLSKRYEEFLEPQIKEKSRIVSPWTKHSKAVDYVADCTDKLSAAVVTGVEIFRSRKTPDDLAAYVWNLYATWQEWLMAMDSMIKSYQEKSSKPQKAIFTKSFSTYCLCLDTLTKYMARDMVNNCVEEIQEPTWGHDLVSVPLSIKASLDEAKKGREAFRNPDWTGGFPSEEELTGARRKVPGQPKVPMPGTNAQPSTPEQNPPRPVQDEDLQTLAAANVDSDNSDDWRKAAIEATQRQNNLEAGLQRLNEQLLTLQKQNQDLLAQKEISASQQRSLQAQLVTLKNASDERLANSRQQDITYQRSLDKLKADYARRESDLKVGFAEALHEMATNAQDVNVGVAHGMANSGFFESDKFSRMGKSVLDTVNPFTGQRQNFNTEPPRHSQSLPGSRYASKEELRFDTGSVQGDDPREETTAWGIKKKVMPTSGRCTSGPPTAQHSRTSSVSSTQSDGGRKGKKYQDIMEVVTLTDESSLDFESMTDREKYEALPAPFNEVPSVYTSHDLLKKIDSEPKLKVESVAPIQFMQWVETYITNIHSAMVPARMKINCLRKCWSESNCSYSIPKHAKTLSDYCRIIVELMSTYGGLDKWVDALKNQLTDTAQLEEHDTEGLRRFYGNLREYLDATNGTKYHNDRGNQEFVKRIYHKLCHSQLMDYLQHMKRTKKEYPVDLDALADWIRIFRLELYSVNLVDWNAAKKKHRSGQTSAVADVQANDPPPQTEQQQQPPITISPDDLYAALVNASGGSYFKPAERTQGGAHRGGGANRGRGGFQPLQNPRADQNLPKSGLTPGLRGDLRNALATAGNESEQLDKAAEIGGKLDPCFTCNEAHLIIRCPKMRTWTPTQMLAAVKANKRCIKCLRKEHKNPADCKWKKCAHCERPHNSRLHGAWPEDKPVDRESYKYMMDVMEDDAYMLLNVYCKDEGFEEGDDDVHHFALYEEENPTYYAEEDVYLFNGEDAKAERVNAEENEAQILKELAETYQYLAARP